MKLKDLNIIVWGGVILLLAMISKLIWWWFVGGEKPTTETPQPSAAPSPQVDTSPFATSQLSQLWSTLDWKTTAVGQHLAQYIPDDLINWVLWPAVIFFLWLIALRIIQKITGKKSTETSSLVPLIVAILMIGGFAVLIAEILKPGDPKPKEVVFQFRDSVAGREKTALMRFYDTAVVVRASPKLGDPRLWACSKIVEPVKTLEPVFLKAVPGSAKGLVSHHRVSPHGKSVLEDAGASMMRVSFILTPEKSLGESPCPISP